MAWHDVLQATADLAEEIEGIGHGTARLYRDAARARARLLRVISLIRDVDEIEMARAVIEGLDRRAAHLLARKREWPPEDQRE